MIQPAFPRTQGNLSRETYLTILLLALVHQTGGELHLSSAALESVDNGGRLLIDWDTGAQQLIIRAGSPTLVVAEVRGTGWTQQPATPQPSQPSSPATHRVMTEDQILEDLKRRMQADRLREWRQQGADAVASMPPPEDPSRP